MDAPFLANDPRLPPYMQMDRKNATLVNSGSRQDVLSDLCVDTEDVFFSSTSRFPPYLRTGNSRERDSVAPNSMTRFTDAHKSMTESGSKPGKPPANSSSTVSDDTNNSCANTSEHVLSKGTTAEAACSGDLADKDCASSSQLRDRKQETCNDLENATNMTPIRDLSAAEADLDCNLLNVSGSAFLTEPASPDVLPMYSSTTSGFSSNVKYRGRSMNSTNNPWVASLDSEDVGEPLQEAEANKDELNANEEVAELTEERNPNQETPPFEKKDTNL
jgi:hypothetical protein